jgi:hypothetical protein
LADWYVYQHDGDPLGPWSTDAVANAILAGKLAPDVWVAAPGGPRWLRALDVPVIGRLVEGIPTRPRRDSGLRLIPNPDALEAANRATVESTMMIVEEAEVLLSDSEASALSTAATAVLPPVTRRSGAGTADDTARFPVRDFTIEEPDPPTDRALPPSSTPSAPPPTRANDDAAAAPSTDRRRRRKNG